RTQTFRTAIAAFIDAARDKKLQGKAGNTEELAKFEYGTWLADAASKIGEIQLTTHPLKATYPDAKIKETTSSFVQGHELPPHRDIGSHLIQHDVYDAT